MFEDDLRFGDWRLLPRTRTLVAGDERIVIGGRAVDILLALIEAGGSVVGRDALIARAWRGRVVGDANLPVQISALRKAFGAEGAQIIATVPGRGYRFGGALQPAPARTPTAAVDATPAWSSRGPSLAVLPFVEIGATDGRSPLADGIVENLITCLSRIRWFYVLPRNSAFSFKARDFSAAEVGRELGVRYVVTGTVHNADARIRVNVDLIEASSGVEVWSDRFDHAADDVFSLQDRIVTSIVGGLEPGLRRVEVEQLRRRPTRSPNAYAAYRLAVERMRPFTRENCDAALALLDQALALDPNYALALVGVARCRLWRLSQRFTDNPSAEADEAVRALEAALALTRDDPHVLAQAGFIFGYLGLRRDTAVALVERAVELYPNASCTRATAGWVHLYENDPATATTHFEVSRRVDPIDPEAGGWLAGLCLSRLMEGHGEAAVRWGERAVAASPEILTAHLAYVAALGTAGQQADTAVADLLSIDPRFNLADYRQLRSRWSHGRWFHHLIDGLHRAGIPEQPAATPRPALKLVRGA
ncbi:MAG TPA: winged helix-turn-helix domain-containing protein [Vineibacter sp.]|nr:winged helix-turn-helix domain-containing protein [Vineibacter sp.]